MLQLVDVYNEIRKQEEFKKNPQLLISGLTLRSETKNKDKEVRKRFGRYLRNGK